jgi:hypothetical protein
VKAFSSGILIEPLEQITLAVILGLIIRVRGAAARERVIEPRRDLSEILEERVVSSRKRWNPRGVKRKMSNYPLRPRSRAPSKYLGIAKCILILK